MHCIVPQLYCKVIAAVEDIFLPPPRLTDLPFDLCERTLLQLCPETLHHNRIVGTHFDAYSNAMKIRFNENNFYLKDNFGLSSELDTSNKNLQDRDLS